jgi:DNA-binding FadR family transcriptional regulator
MRTGGKRCAAVAAELGERIVCGGFAPGETLPTEAALCTQLGVSRTTVREAIKRLQAKGLVAARPRNGTRVLPTLHWNQFDTEVLAWRVAGGVDADMLDQLYEIRDCFEPRACHLAAIRGSALDRARIGDHFAELAAAQGDTERGIAADLDFHLAIFAATGNLFFISLAAAIRTALHLSFSLSQRSAPIPSEELHLHEDVCAAIVAGDGPGAAHSMRHLLNASRRTLGIALHHASEKPT